MSFQQQIKNNIAQIRQQATAFLFDTCTIKRRTGTTSINGEPRPTYATGEVVACRIIIRSGSSESNVAAQERTIQQTFYKSTYRIQLPYGTDVKVADHIEYTDIATETVRVFEVTFVPVQNEYTGAFIVGVDEVE